MPVPGLVNDRMPKLFIDASIRIGQVEVHLVSRRTQGHEIRGRKDSARSLAHLATSTVFCWCSLVLNDRSGQV